MAAASTGAAAPPRRREQWTSQTGFIFAAIGSAVGLGNIWRFPGVAYDNGGGAFMVPYLVALLVAGIPILFFDYAIGHRFRGSPPLAFARLHPRAESLGWFQVTISAVIAIYYAVVVAWAASYFFFSFDLRYGADAGAFFGEFLQISGELGVSLEVVPAVILPLMIVWVAAIALLGSGLVKGVERANVIFIPLLAVAFTALVVRALFLDGASAGLDALFTPQWSALGDPTVWIAAFGQIFFSLSVAFGIMITYASYRKRKANLTGSGLVVAFANSSFEILAGVGVFATLGFMAFQQGVAVSELSGLTGVGLSFITFPTVIAQMPGGAVFGVLFFGSLVVAGFTSFLSILQVVSGALQDKFDLTPRQAAVRLGIPFGSLSVLLFSTTTGLFALDVVDNWTNNLGIVASAVIMTVVVLWGLKRGPELTFHLTAVSSFPVGRTWRSMVSVAVPVALGFMLVRTAITLVQDGYAMSADAMYPGWYVAIFGWGVLALMAVLAVGLSVGRWRSEPLDFTPWPTHPARESLAVRTEDSL